MQTFQRPMPVTAVQPKSTVRVCVVLTRLGAGGPPVVVLDLLTGLRQQGIDAILVVGSRDKQHDCETDYPALQNVPVVYVDAMSRSVHWMNDLRALFALYRIFRELRPDVVHSHTSKAGVLGRLSALAARVPVVTHTFHGNVLKGYFGPLLSQGVRIVETLLAAGSDALFVLSRQQATEIVGEFRIAPRHKVHVVPLGIDAKRFEEIPPPRLSRRRLTVGWFGRFVPVKDTQLLAQVISQCMAQSDEIDFVIAGDGPERHVVEEAVRQNTGRVRYLGWVPDLRAVLPEVDVVVQTSRNEGTPVALLEGMAAARPFVSTAVGGVVDMVSGTPCEKPGSGTWFGNAVLTDHDPAVIVNALKALGDDRRLLSQMGCQARDLVLRRFVPQNYVDRTVFVYLCCLAGNINTFRTKSIINDC